MIDFFTGMQTMIMVIAAVICVFCIIGVLIAVGAHGGINGVAIAMFTVAIICVLILAAPVIVKWIQGWVGS